MTTHEIKPIRENLHGRFSKDYAPVLTIEPGDTVVYSTLDARWHIEKAISPSQFGKRFEPRGEFDDGHALCGPITINGAKPGMMLAIQIEKIVPGTYGYTTPWFPELGGSREVDNLVWRLDAAAMTGTDNLGNTVKLDPFMGVMGMPPTEEGQHSTAPPRATGGNLDCKELVVGTTLYLPIAVDGGLFSVGDGHGRQGDGEVAGCAIECPMDEVQLTFDLIENPLIPTAYANAPCGWMTFGFDEDMNGAANEAMMAMIGLMGHRLGLGKTDALALAGVIVDLRITQIVNGTRGAHAILPHDALEA